MPEHTPPPVDNTPPGAAGLPMDNLTVYPYPWVATICRHCQSWFTRAIDLRAHHDSQHPAMSLRFSCTKCQALFRRWNGIASHYARCRGPPTPVPAENAHTCTCGRPFTTRAGLTIHRNTCQPDARNAERLAPPPVPPVLRASQVWTEEEDNILCTRYWEYRATGRLQGYAAYVAQELPRKTDVQVRDRTRTLKNAGLLEAPVPPPVQPPEEEPVPPAEPEPGDRVDAPDEPATPPQRGDLREETVDNTDTISDGRSEQNDSPQQQHRHETPTRPEPLLLPEAPLAEHLPDEIEPDLDAAPPNTATTEPPNQHEEEDWRQDWHRILTTLQNIEPLCPIGMRIRQLAEKEGDIQDELDSLIEELHQALREAAPTEGRRQATERGTRPARAERTRRNATRYARTQDLWKKNPSRLASLVIGDNLGDLIQDGPRVDPPREATTNLFQGLWGSACDTTLRLPRPVAHSNARVDPILPREVTQKIRRLRPGGAPGPDGVTKKGLTAYPHAANTLAVVFNVALFRGTYPRAWLKNRTTLIPKAGKDLAKAENWRPITIAPIAGRIFSGMVEARLLRQVTVSERQRGFRPGNGCHVNCWILDEVLRQGKRSRVVGVQLDVSKAFDTVSHAAIAEVLSSHGVSPCLLQVIRRMYTGCSTTLGNFGVNIDINRGVKQGDPLSPLLFNLVLDPLLGELHSSGEGFTIGDHKLAAMAYADDLTLFADTTEGMKNLLQKTEEYLAGVGMALSGSKCGGFNIEQKKEAWVALPLDLTIQGQPLHTFTASSTFEYLGLTFSIRRGFQNRQHLDVLCESAVRVRRLALKPDQKVTLLMQYVVPAFAHRLAIDTPSQNDLDRVDTYLRGEVKKILHLHPSTTDSLLYTRKKDGGLGFPHLIFQARLCGLRAATALLGMDDALLQELGRVGGWPAYVERLAGQLRVPYPPSPRDLQKAKQDFKNAEFRRWTSQLAHGQGVSWFRNNPLGNHWLLNTTALKPGQFIDALKLRTNTFGTRTAINRAARNNITICRRCNLKPETLGHVIGECTAGQRARIERHNWIVGRIEEDCKRRGLVVAREQQFIVDGERLKPDLVIKSQDRTFVADVTLPYENGLSLSAAALSKATKYQPLLPSVQMEFGTTSGEVIPVVIGARGALPQATVTALKKIGITERRTLLDFTLLALRTSIDICRGHLDYG